MGGHAFGTTLGPSASFPRMELATYERLREYVTNLLTTRFSSVSVAREDPAKRDFGDLDVVLATESYKGETKPTDGKLREELRVLLRASRAVSNGSHFLSFAIPASTLDTHLPKQRVDISGAGDGSLNETGYAPDVDSDADAKLVIYHQVDVNLAKTDEELEAMPFYSSYGDLGMIISLIFKTIGMSYSTQGLKVRVAHVAPSKPSLLKKPLSFS